MPNLLCAAPVEIFAWDPAATSGLTRKPIGAVRPIDRATSDSMSASATDFEVELAEPPSQSERHLRLGLADAGKDDLLRRDAGRAGAPIFAARDDVRAEPFRRQRRQHRGIRIGLDRKSDQRIAERRERRLSGPAPARCIPAVE